MICKKYLYLLGVLFVDTVIVVASVPMQKVSEIIANQNHNRQASQNNSYADAQYAILLQQLQQPVIGSSHVVDRRQENVKKDDTILVTGARRGGPFDRARRLYSYNFFPVRQTPVVQVPVAENQHADQSYNAYQNQNYRGRGRGSYRGRGRGAYPHRGRARGFEGNNT